MKAFWLLTRQRVLDVMRSRSTVSFVLIFPVALLLVVGLVFANGHPFELRHIAVVGDGPAFERAVALLAGYEELVVERLSDPEEAAGKLRARMVSGVLSAPGDALVEGGRPAGGREAEGVADGGVVLTVGARERLLGRGVEEALRGGGVAVVTRVAPVSRWGYVHYLFAGILAFSVMMSGLFATGYVMAMYRQNRFLKKLATTPLPKWQFVAAIIAGRGSLIYGQIALMVATGALAFGVPVSLASLAWLALIAGLGLLAFMGLGFVLACLIRTDDLLVDIISAVNMPLVLLSEIFFPLDALPRPLALAGEYLPSTEMVRLLRSVLLYGVTEPSRLLAGLGVLALWAALSFALSLKIFRWHS